MQIPRRHASFQAALGTCIAAHGFQLAGEYHWQVGMGHDTWLDVCPSWNEPLFEALRQGVPDTIGVVAKIFFFDLQGWAVTGQEGCICSFSSAQFDDAAGGPWQPYGFQPDETCSRKVVWRLGSSWRASITGKSGWATTRGWTSARRGMSHCSKRCAGVCRRSVWRTLRTTCGTKRCAGGTPSISRTAVPQASSILSSGSRRRGLRAADSFGGSCPNRAVMIAAFSQKSIGSQNPDFRQF